MTDIDKLITEYAFKRMGQIVSNDPEYKNLVLAEDPWSRYDRHDLDLIVEDMDEDVGRGMSANDALKKNLSRLRRYIPEGDVAYSPSPEDSVDLNITDETEPMFLEDGRFNTSAITSGRRISKESLKGVRRRHLADELDWEKNIGRKTGMKFDERPRIRPIRSPDPDPQNE